MNAQQMSQHLRKRPFEPFRVHLANGSSYEVRHLEMAILRPRELIVGVGQWREGIVEQVAFCDLRHITHVETANGADSEPQSPPED